MTGRMAMGGAILASSMSLAAENADQAAVRANLAKNLPHLTTRSITPTRIPGVLEVQVEEKGAVFYVSEDGAYLVAGDLYELTGSGLYNVSERTREVRRRELLAEIDLADVIAFAVDGNPRSVVHVFTDVDCPFSRAFHQEIPKLNRYGIEVRYLAYPRTGLASGATYEKMVAAWCSEDRQTAIEKLMLGEQIPATTCEHPVDGQLTLGSKAHVEGSPTLITETGQRIEGHVDADELATMLGIVLPQ